MTELELIASYRSAATKEDRDEAFAALLLCPSVAGLIRRLTDKYERRVHDAQSILYLYLWQALDTLPEGDRLTSLCVSAERELQAHLPQQLVHVLPHQHKRYRVIRQALREGLDLETARADRLSKTEYLRILSFDDMRDITAVRNAPDLEAMEQQELEEVLTICGEVLDNDQQGIFQYRHWLDETANLSWERVAEEMNDELEDSIWNRKTVSSRYHDGIKAIQTNLGIACQRG